EARWAYYAKAFPADVRFTPATLLNGRPNTAGGHLKHDRKAGDLYRDAHRNYSLLSDAVDELVETVPGVRITAEADRQGDRVGLRVAVRGLPGPDDGKRLRVVLVEEAVRYVGSNGLRFHHNVVRAMPGGPDGVALREKDGEHRLTVDLAALRAGL